jgi:integrase
VGKHCPYLHQRGDRYYFFWKRDGKRVEESLRTTDLQVAKQRHQKRMIEIESGCSPNDRSGWTLQKAADDWLDQRQFEVSTGSLKAERSILRNLLREFKADSRLQSLADISKLRKYQHDRLKAGKSPKTINNEVQVLRGILELALLWQRVERQYKPLRVKKSDIPDALTKEESVRFLQLAAKSSPTAVAPFVATLALSSGARKGEIERLKRKDLHQREIQPFIQIRRATTKTDAGSRRVALDSIGVWSVEKLLARACLVGSLEPEDYLLPTDRARHTRTGDPWHGDIGFDPRHHQTSWQWEWDRFRSAAGLTHRRFHDLRHSYITRAAEAGVPISVVQAQVGHMGARMVDWYTHISSQALHKAACLMEAESPELVMALGIGRNGSVLLADGDGAAGTQTEQVVVASDLRPLSNPEPHHPWLRRRCRESSLRPSPNTTNPTTSGSGCGSGITCKRESSLINGSE